MSNTKNKEILISNYPSGRWVATGPSGDILTSECDREKALKFIGGNDCAHVNIEPDLVWPSSMFKAPTEHKSEAGDLFFTDRGNRVTFDRVRVSDDEIRLALAHAQQKFGQQLTLTGNDPIFTERMARLADDMGMTILNPELRMVIANHRTDRVRQEPVTHSHVAEKRSLWPFLRKNT